MSEVTEKAADRVIDMVYTSVDDMITDGATEEQFALIDGFKEGGPKIRIGSVSAGDVIAWQETNEGEAKKTAGLRLIIKSLVDMQGRRYSTDKDILKLRQVRHSITERILGEIVKLNGMSKKKDADAKND
jgi:hypothetical protein